MSDEISVDIGGRIATVTLNRPDAMNAVSATMHRELPALFRRLATDDAVDVVVLTGEGKAFCAGGDLGWMQAMIDDPSILPALIEETKAIVLSLLDLPKPVICRMNGDAVGLGATLTLCADVIIAADTARWGDPHVRVGLTAGDGCALLLPAAVGTMKAKELLLTGDLLTAQEAHTLGLINHVVPAAELDARVDALAAKLARGAQQALRHTKAALNAPLRAQAATQMDIMMAYEALTMRSPDHAEAVAAMREGRRPQFGQPASR